MTDNEPQIDQLLACALRGEIAVWTSRAKSEGVERVVEQIHYHGISGLLANRLTRLVGWPVEAIASIREQALAQAMWELRHREVLRDLLAAFAQEKILAVLLKGTAVAYDLYSSPATRSRGDSDVLIAAADLDRARGALRQLGYRPHPIGHGMSDDLSLQEVWSLTCDGGTQHHIDLHTQLMNAPALRTVLPSSECLADPVALPRLCPDALAMDRVLTLIHTCVHRTMHVTAPYFVDSVAFYGGDRLIWAHDIHLLAGALSEAEWTRLCALAIHKGVSTVCLDGLTTAQRFLNTTIPATVLERLNSTSGEDKASIYLLHSNQFSRARQDLTAIRGLRRKIAYFRTRSLPSAKVIRSKYPKMARKPIALLYLRRVVELIRARPERSEG